MATGWIDVINVTPFTIYVERRKLQDGIQKRKTGQKQTRDYMNRFKFFN